MIAGIAIIVVLLTGWVVPCHATDLPLSPGATSTGPQGPQGGGPPQSPGVEARPSSESVTERRLHTLTSVNDAVLQRTDVAPQMAAPREFVIKPKLYVLAIGIASYDEDMALTFPAKDAQDLAAAFKAQEGKLYRGVETRLVLNKDATQKNVIAALQWLRREVTAKDVAVLFLAGHGITEPRRGDYFFVPYGGVLQDPEGTLVAGRLIQTVLTDLPGKVVLFLDTCHAGRLLLTSAFRGGPDASAFVRELVSADNGIVVFAASSGRQMAQESRRWNNGAFTRAVVEGLRGDADRLRTGRVTLNMLDLYVSERVKELTEGKQTPTTAKPETVSDFPLAVSTGSSPPKVIDQKRPRWRIGVAVGALGGGALLSAFGVSALTVDGSCVTPTACGPHYVTQGVGVGLLVPGLLLIGGGALLVGWPPPQRTVASRAAGGGLTIAQRQGRE